MRVRSRGERQPHPIDGCRWCGVTADEHRDVRAPVVGLHTWQAPTALQRQSRAIVLHGAGAQLVLAA